MERPWRPGVDRFGYIRAVFTGEYLAIDAKLEETW
jgi:hypothetical protein